MSPTEPDLRYWSPTDATETHDGLVYRLYVEIGTHEYAERWVEEPNGRPER